MNSSLPTLLKRYMKMIGLKKKQTLVFQKRIEKMEVFDENMTNLKQVFLLKRKCLKFLKEIEELEALLNKQQKKYEKAHPSL